MPVNTFVENTWYVAGRSQDFPVNEPKGLRLCNRPVLLWRTAEGKLTAFDDRCVHKRMPLSQGRAFLRSSTFRSQRAQSYGHFRWSSRTASPGFGWATRRRARPRCRRRPQSSMAPDGTRTCSTRCTCRRTTCS